jgi:hypothetical protein
MRMRHIVICGPTGSTVLFPHCLKNGKIYKKKKLLNEKCAFWFFLKLLYELFLILRRTERARLKNYTGIHILYPSFFPDFNETWIFSTDFLGNTRIPNFMKIHSVGAELFDVDGRKDIHDEANSRFRNFSKAPKSDWTKLEVNYAEKVSPVFTSTGLRKSTRSLT